MIPISLSPLQAGFEAVLVAAFLLALGYLIADASRLTRSTDNITSLALALPSVCAFATVLMIANMLSGGRVFSDPLAVRVPTILLALSLLALKLRRGRHGSEGSFGSKDKLALGLLLAAGLIIWGSPLVRMVPLPSGGDTSFHMGWTNQLLNGEPVPSAPITGAVPNYYPWLFHALLALVTWVVPGSRPHLALGPVQLLLVSSSVLAFFEIGRSVTRTTRGGGAAAVFGALSGGIGFLWVREVDVVTDPRTFQSLRYMGDLMMLRSYNGSMFNIVPPLPRDLGLALLIPALLALVKGVTEQRRRMLVAGGVYIGLCGLTGAEAFMVGSLAILALSLLPWHERRLATALTVIVSTALTYSLWAVPTAIAYLQLGGFVNMTFVRPVTLPALHILVTWGVVTPLAILGLPRLLRERKDPGCLVVLSFLLAAGATLMLASALPALLGEAFETLGRHHRYWPILHLGLALVASIGFVEGSRALAKRHRAIRTLTTAGVIACAIPSAVIASVAVPDEIAGGGLIRPALRGRDKQLLSELSPSPGQRCVAAAPLNLQTVVFSWTGYRMVEYQWNRYLEGNESRVRWADIYDRIPPTQERHTDNRALVTYGGGAERWMELVDKYDVDVVVMARPTATSRPNDRPPAQSYESRQSAVARERRRTVLWVNDCRDRS